MLQYQYKNLAQEGQRWSKVAKLNGRRI